MKKGLVLILVLAWAYSAYAQFFPEPSVLNSTYYTTDPAGMKLRVAFKKSPGQLMVQKEWSNGKTEEIPIVFQRVLEVEAQAASLAPNGA